MSDIAALPERGVVAVGGADRVAFLQGLVSNDVTLAAPGTAVWAALLTPQGRWLADFFIIADGERLLLDAEAAQVGDIVRILSRFRLRMKVTIADASAAYHVHVAWGAAPDAGPGCLVAADPRLPGAGWRVLSPRVLTTTRDAADWDARRLELGLPAGSADLEAEKSLLLEAGFDELNGVSWTKGCYMGQELTARTKYRGLVKRRLMPVDLDGEAGPGTAVLRAGVEVGVLRSRRGDRGMAQLRLEAIGDAGLTCGAARLQTRMPAWMRLPGSATPAKIG